MQTLTDERKKELIDNLANNLPVLRAKLGLSQAELSERIGLRRMTINSAESGRSRLTFNSFVALTMIFLYNDETRALVEMLGLFPADLQAFLMFEQWGKNCIFFQLCGREEIIPESMNIIKGLGLSFIPVFQNDIEIAKMNKLPYIGDVEVDAGVGRNTKTQNILLEAAAMGLGTPDKSPA